MNQEYGKPVVVGFDGSKAAHAALDAAARQASLAGVALVVVTTWLLAENYGYAMAFPSNYDPEADAKTMLAEAVAPLAETYPELTIATHAVRGEAREVLVDRSRDASMLVLGSRGHGVLAGMLLGSVSGYCVAHAQCPTLVVR